MNILYLTSACSQQLYNKLVYERKICTLPPAQKFHHLLLQGLRKISNDKIVVISSRPVSNRIQKRYKYLVEYENGIEYNYPFFYNISIIRQVCLFINVFILLLKKISRKDDIIVCDILDKSISFAARLVRLFKSVKVIGVVTDVPGKGSNADNVKYKFIHSAIVRISEYTMSKYDGYLFLTQAMDEVVNLHHKPYVVIEGQSDILMKCQENHLSNKFDVNIIMYAGSLHKEYGIATLVDAFISVNNPNWELHIYGVGNYKEELDNIIKKYPRIKYWGMKPNEDIISAQIKSRILVNPRPTGADFVKYSFPSKTLESMASGTPLLTTKLPGMPKEYYPYVYFIEDETANGFKEALINIFNISYENLHMKGKQAKEFVLNEKNNIKQAGIFYSFLQQL